MRPRTVSAFVAVVIACVISGTDRVQACSCIAAGPACQETWRAGAVFIGRVAEIVPETGEQVADRAALALTGLRVRLEVSEAFRGDVARVVDVYTGTSSSSCGYEFDSGRRYLIYAHWQPTLSRWTTGLCSRTRPVEAAKEDLEYLRGPARQPSGRGTLQGVATREDPDPVNEYREFWKRPYPNARIVVESIGTKTISRYETRTVADGRYSIAVPTGKYTVTPMLPSTLYAWTPRSVDVLDPRGCAEMSFSVRSDGRIAGRVVDASGAPVPHVTVEAIDARSAAQPHYDTSTRTTTDATGKFEFRQLPPDTYRLGLDLRKRPREDSAAVWFSDEPGGPPAEVMLGLEQQVWTRDYVLPNRVVFAPITGVVVDAADKPLGQARVYLISVTSDRILAETTTNRDGEFRFGARVGTDYRLVAEYYVAPGPGRRAESRFRAAFELPAFRLKLER